MSTTTLRERVCITGVGMVSSLGFDVANSCAAARAGIARSSELKVLNFIGDGLWGEEPVMGHAVSAISNGFVGLGKVLQLGRCALKNILRSREISSSEWCRTGIYINLSDQFFEDAYSISEREAIEELVMAYAADEDSELGEDDMESCPLPSTIWREQCRGLIPRLMKSLEISVPPVNQQVYFGGHTGIINAIQDARENMRLDKIERCVIGGIDCCIEPRFLFAAAANGVLRTSLNPLGFVPGEAAGFFLLEKLEQAQSRRVDIACFLGNDAIGREKFNRLSDNFLKGIALYQTIESTLSTLANPAQELGLIIGDLNGDEYRAQDWGYALVRLHNKYKIGELPLWLPAVAFGETGAATGALAICMGIRALERKYAPESAILVWLSSDSGSKATISLERMPV